MIDQEAAFSFQQLTISSVAVTLTATVGLNNAHRAVITCETNPIRFRYDGTNPTSTVGHILYPADKLILEGRVNISNFSAIRASTATDDAVLMITYETI